MNREQLAHVLRAAAQITEDGDILVLGSHSILGAFDADDLPATSTRSIEVDIAFWEDETEEKADRVEGAIGELSAFHELYGYYAHGVTISTVVLPEGWRERLWPSRGETPTRAQRNASNLMTWSSRSSSPVGRRTSSSRRPSWTSASSTRPSRTNAWARSTNGSGSESRPRVHCAM